eukprot:4604691-Lingulodinium_polyedra.AAC.1
MTARPSTAAGPATPRSAPSSGTPPLEAPPALPGAARAGRGPPARSARWPEAPKVGRLPPRSRMTAGDAGSPR